MPHGYPEIVRKLCSSADQDPEPDLRRTILGTSPSSDRLNTEKLSSGRPLGQLTKFCPTTGTQPYLMGRIAGQKGPDWPDGQAIDQAARTIAMLGAVPRFGHRADCVTMSIKDWHRAARFGWTYTSSGEPDVQTGVRLMQAELPNIIYFENRLPKHQFGSRHHGRALRTNHDDRGPICDGLR